MLAKLIVHKIEDGVDFKSLQITLGNKISETTFSDWKECKSEQKKKNSDSSRLVVKLVSDSDLLQCIDLDSCFKEISKSKIYSNYKDDWISYDKNDQSEISSENNEDKPKVNTYDFDYFNKLKGTETQVEFYKNFPKDNKTDNTHGLINDLCLLEYSLEKVKENNAKIMENIQMLNRTLNYTKKKEILNVIRPCSKTMKTFPCKICGKCFVYVTGLKRHYAIRHIMPESQQRWQIVWTCTECFQVWPRQDLALNHSDQCRKREGDDCIREIKTSSLLQCEFCEKVFTSIPRLLRHSKIHTIASNYECNACNMSFQSYKIAEQHWLFCPWFNMYYRFSLPKLLLCNACDRKFRNYEQLYNHRYKVGHFITKVKTECNAKSSCLVYQCEVCSEWFHSIPPLQAHRNHYHPSYDSGFISRTDPFTA